MKSNEKIFSLICISALLVLISYAIWRKNTINEDPIFVLAKINKVTSADNGLIYDFVYTYNNQKYTNHTKGFIKLRDSLIFLKLSKKNPKLWTLLNDKQSKCLILKDSLTGIWEELPNCK